MKRLILITLSVILCSSLLFSCGNKTDGEGTDTTDKGDSVTMKTYDTVFSRGMWLTDDTVYEGNSDDSQKYVSTQKFSKDTLPSGSEIKISDGIVCRMTKWTKFPEGADNEKISGGYKTDYVITDELWSKYDYVAFDFNSVDESTIVNPSDVFEISVPSDAKDRRDYSTWNDDETLAILTVGNSFSEDAVQYVYEIAKAAGIKNVVLADLYYGACRLSWHYKYWSNNEAVYNYRHNENGVWLVKGNSSFKEAFGKYDWDFISFQESAQEIQSKDELYTDFSSLIQMAEELCPNAKIVWHMPWANKHVNYQNSIETMYRDSMTAQRRILETYPEVCEIITTGTAIQNARTSFVPADDYLRDGWHLSLGFGRYIASLTFFTQLTGISIENNSFCPDGVSEAYKKVAIEAAENARKNPRLVTQSVYTENPDKEKLENLDKYYDLLSIDYVTGYINAAAGATVVKDSNYLTTPVFTEKDIPVGSLIVIEDGFRCRPEGWYKYPEKLKEAERPPFITTGSAVVYEVTESFWQTYTSRVFNLSIPSGSSRTLSELDTAMKIYIPKK